MKTIKEYWKKNRTIHGQFAQCPRLQLADGFSMSVQASALHYCSPREILENGGYYSYEVGFPNRKEILLKDYAEEWDKATKTVYGYVPSEVIDAIIEKHGGIAKARGEA